MTPAIAVVYQVDEGIRLMTAEGADGVFARHEACAAASRAGLTALGFELFADPQFASKTVTAAVVPDDLDWKAFNGEVKRRGVVLAGGQGKLTGKIFRLGHLGSVTLEEILGAMSIARDRVDRGRATGPPGAAVAAAQVAALESFGVVAADRRRGGCMRVLVAEPVASEGIDLLRARHEVDERPGLSRDELCAIMPDYDALIVRSQVQVDAGLIAAGTRLAVIGRAGVGVDNVDLEAATRAGIIVVNAPTGNTIAAAEHTLALLYGVARRIGGGRCLGPSRRVEAAAVHRARAARPDARHRRSRQDRPGDRGPRPGDGDDRPRGRPVRDRRGGGQPRRRTRRARRDARPGRRRHRPRAAHARRPAA